jgi:hypothetical protein
MFGANLVPGLFAVTWTLSSVFVSGRLPGVDSPREVYPPLFEALSWAHSLRDTWFRLVEPQDRHLEGLRYVHDRCHHQLASAVYPDVLALRSVSDPPAAGFGGLRDLRATTHHLPASPGRAKVVFVLAQQVP